MKTFLRLTVVLLFIAGGLIGQGVVGNPVLETSDLIVYESGCGAGLSPTGSGGCDTASGETGFFASGALTCGAGTAGRAQVHTTPLQYCDNAATPALQYAAFADSTGDALAGDSATAFFDAGQIEAARGGTGIDTSGSTGVLRVTTGTWTADAGISHLASSTSADLRGVLSDETGGAGLAVFNINPTLTDVTVDDLLTFSESAGDATCAAGDYWIKGNSTSGTLRGCENGTLFTVNAAGASGLSLGSCEALTISAGAVTFTGDANTITCHTIDTEAAAGSDDLTSITCTAGSWHLITAANATRTVVVTDGAGVQLQANFSLDNTEDKMLLECPATNTVAEVNRANNGA